MTSLSLSLLRLKVLFNSFLFQRMVQTHKKKTRGPINKDVLKQTHCLMLSQVAFPSVLLRKCLALIITLLADILKSVKRNSRMHHLTQLLVAIGYITQKRCLMRNRSKRLFYIYRKVHSGILALMPLNAKRCQI